MKNISWRGITELIAALSIVLSLIFVGLELRENSAIARSEAYNAYTTNVAQAQIALGSDPVLMPIMRRAFQSEAPSEFTVDEYFHALQYF